MISFISLHVYPTLSRVIFLLGLFLIFYSISASQFSLYKHHSWICSWNQPVLSNLAQEKNGSLSRDLNSRLKDKESKGEPS